jgi:hypothetical protein
MNFSCLKDLILNHKDHIIQDMNRRLSQVPWSPYQEFILRTKEGQRRLKTWVGLLIRSLVGERETFYKDQERVGYARAMQGFALENNLQVYCTFQQILREILQEEIIKKGGMLPENLYTEIHDLN